jgi:transcriptional regulator with XRE-family HTH domain
MNRDAGCPPRRASGEQRRILVAGKRESETGQADKGREESVFTEARLVLAKLLTARIKELHITRKEIERRSNISIATIREIEHPRVPRTFGRDVLEPVSEALEWPPDYLVRAAYPLSSEAADRIVQDMMAALAPYLEKIDAIVELQRDVAEIKADLKIRADVVYQLDDRPEA